MWNRAIEAMPRERLETIQLQGLQASAKEDRPMDRERFDALAKLVSPMQSRRAALATLLGAALLATVPGLAAKPKRKGKGKAHGRRGKRQREGRRPEVGICCLPACGNDHPCPEGRICRDGACVEPCEVCARGCAYDTVEKAVAAAAPGTTIAICAGLFRTNVVIAKNVTLVGAGAGSDPATDTVLDGNDADRVLEIARGITVTVRNLRITKGRPTFHGGGISNAGALTLESVTVAGNTAARGRGGGISNVGTLTLDDSTVANNTSVIEGGGIYNSGTLTLDGSTVADNTSARNNGGGIENWGSLTLRNHSDVSDNTAAVDGGGINQRDGTLTLEAGCSVRHNTAGYRGGGIQILGGTATIASTAIVTHNAARGNPNNCSPEGAVPNCIG